MSSVPIGASESPPLRAGLRARMSAADLPAGAHITGLLLRAAFIGALLLMTLRVSMPQSASIWDVYETPGDLIRLCLGLAAGAWIVAQLFSAPHDSQRYRTWFYLGLVAVPFVLICLVGIW